MPKSLAKTGTSNTGSRPGSGGFGRLARRIWAWTSRGVVIGLILVVGLGFGRRVIQWWSAEGPSPVGPAQGPQIADGLGDPARVHLLRFGDQPWAVRRKSVQGGKRAATNSLRDMCRQLVDEAGPPDGSPAAEERRFLASLAERPPVEQHAGRWQLYELPETLPMVVGVGQPLPPPKTGDNLATQPSRVVTWGIAVPSGLDTWALYMFRPEPRAGGPIADLPEIPLPPEAHSTLGLQVEGGGAMIGFEGPRTPETWRRFYDQHFSQRGWKASGPWQSSQAGWFQRYVAPADSPVRAVDVRFGPDGGTGLLGLLITTPAAEKH